MRNPRRVLDQVVSVPSDPLLEDTKMKIPGLLTSPRRRMTLVVKMMVDVLICIMAFPPVSTPRSHPPPLCLSLSPLKTPSNACLSSSCVDFHRTSAHNSLPLPSTTCSLRSILYPLPAPCCHLPQPPPRDPTSRHSSLCSLPRSSHPFHFLQPPPLFHLPTSSTSALPVGSPPPSPLTSLRPPSPHPSHRNLVFPLRRPSTLRLPTVRSLPPAPRHCLTLLHIRHPSQGATSLLFDPPFLALRSPYTLLHTTQSLSASGSHQSCNSRYPTPQHR